MGYDAILLAGVDDKFTTTRPLGAHKCAHELRVAGYKVLVIDQYPTFNDSQIAAIFKTCITDATLFVGVSNTFMGKKINGVDLKTIIRNYSASCQLLIGGASTYMNREYPGFDYAISGYADISIVNLANHLRHGEELRNARRTIHKITFINDPIATGFDFYNSKMEWHPDDMIMHGRDHVLPLEVSRGCIFACKFCYHRLNGRDSMDYVKKYSTLKEELIFNYENYGITTYRILDDTFNDSREKITKILAMIKELPFKPKFWAYIRLDLLSKHPETIQQLVDIGVISMTFGIETFNKESGRIIGKGYDPEEQIKTINHIKNTYGDKVEMFSHFIVGLPKESKESVLASIARLESGEIKLDKWRFNPLAIVRGDETQWGSAFGLDLTKFGYQEIGATPTKIIWENEYMTYKESCAIAETTVGNGVGRKNATINFELLNMGAGYGFTGDYNDIYENYIRDYHSYVFNYLAINTL